ncbi:GTPase-associated system all-helical protein GASH [Rhizobium ruizarguesonis]
MAQDVLQNFLNVRLFDLGGDDNKLKQLRDASADLAAKFKSDPAKIPSFVIVAIDSKVDPDEPIFKNLAEVVGNRWNSYMGAFSDAIIPTVMRAVILEAIARSLDDDRVAIAVSLTARSLLPHLGSPMDEALWTEIVNDADTRLENRARREWALPASTAAEPPKIELPEIENFTYSPINVAWLTGQLNAAVGPSDKEGQALKNPNPHWPNAGNPWSYEFAPRAAQAIASAVDAVSKATAAGMTERAKADDRIRSAMDQVLAYASKGSTIPKALERRTSLLWWKEALYSPTADASYRHFTVGKACAWMALDAVEITGPFAPRMAEALLAETLRSFRQNDADEPISLAQLCLEVRDIGQNEGILTSLATVRRAAARSQLTSMIAQADAIDIPATLGLPSDVKVSPVAFALWIYRDLQIAQATAVPAKSKRKAAQ